MEIAKRTLAPARVYHQFVTCYTEGLEEAIADARRRHNDWRYVILEIWTIVWPKDEPKVK
jgi:hypothetical protein